MVFFNYEKLFLASRGDSKTIVKHFLKKSTVGINWIINDSIIQSNLYTDQMKAEYLGLCALRNYSDFSLYKNKDLDLYMIPDWIPEIVILNCPFVKIDKTKLIFLYEGN